MNIHIYQGKKKKVGWNYTSQTKNHYKNIIWQHKKINSKTENSLCMSKKKHNLLPSCRCWRMVSISHQSYLMKMAGATVAVCVVSHPHASHLCLREEKIEEEETRVNINKVTPINSSIYLMTKCCCCWVVVFFSNLSR